MSYILDALQKNQREQTPEGMSLSLNRTQPRSHIVKWLIAALAVVVVFNVALVAWIFVDPKTDTLEVASTAPDAPPQQSTPSSTVTERIPPPPRTDARTTPDEIPRRPVRPPSSAAPIERAAPPRAASATPPASAPRTPAPAAIALNELPLREQTIYNDLDFSTHLFTDVQSECVITVNGQSLRVGDSFKGLTLARVTEMGAVFAERRNGRLRHVEVPVVERLGE